MSGFQDLEIYQDAYNLAIKIHHVSLKLPKYETLGKRINSYIQYVEKNWSVQK